MRVSQVIIKYVIKTGSFLWVKRGIIDNYFGTVRTETTSVSAEGMNLLARVKEIMHAKMEPLTREGKTQESYAIVDITIFANIISWYLYEIMNLIEIYIFGGQNNVHSFFWPRLVYKAWLNIQPLFHWFTGRGKSLNVQKVQFWHLSYFQREEILIYNRYK